MNCFTLLARCLQQKLLSLHRLTREIPLFGTKRALWVQRPTENGDCNWNLLIARKSACAESKYSGEHVNNE